MSWLDNTTNDEANLSAIQFWNQLKSSVQNEFFWADKIKEFHGEPVKKLEMALGNLPLPAAFNHAAVALRSLIREKRKLKREYEDELSLLFWLAAINSFMIPYSKYLRQPGYNVMEAVPGKVIKTLTVSYFEVGYSKLELLNKTDIKWFIEKWGEPKEHTTLNEMYCNLWHKYEKITKANQKKELNKLLKNLD